MQKKTNVKNVNLIKPVPQTMCEVHKFNFPCYSRKNIVNDKDILNNMRDVYNRVYETVAYGMMDDENEERRRRRL